MGDSNAKSAPRKSAKAEKEKLELPKKKAGFPLTPHSTGKWQKKIHGKTRYFGAWAKRENGELVGLEDDGRDAALAAYNRFVFEQLYGRPPASGAGELTVGRLCNLYMEAQQDRLDSGDIKPKTFAEYEQACDLVVEQFSGTRPVSTLSPNDFLKLRATMAKRWGVERLSKFIGYTKAPFTWGIDEGEIKHVMAFGKYFKRPSAALMRENKAEDDERMFTAAEIWQLLDGRKAGNGKAAVAPASPQMRAIILLGLNSGMGNTDVALLPIKRIDFKTGFVAYKRTKKAIRRRFPLWPETATALKAVLRDRDTDSGLVFITRWGNPWVDGKTDSIGLEFGKRMRALGIDGRKSLGYYSLRHTFRTVADETLDEPAINLIMGHVQQGMSAKYRQRIDDKRLVVVTNHVRSWLLAGNPRASWTPRKPR